MENTFGTFVNWYIENQILITYILFLVALFAAFVLNRIQSRLIDTQKEILGFYESAILGFYESANESLAGCIAKFLIERKEEKQTLKEVREASKKKNLQISKANKKALIYQNMYLSMMTGGIEASFNTYSKEKMETLKKYIETKKEYLKTCKKKKSK